MLIQCLDSSLRASSVDYPLICFQGLAIVLRWPRNLIYRLQISVGPAPLDTSVRELLSKMNEVYTFLTTAELKAIESMKTTVARITHQTVECSYFIQAYCRNQVRLEHSASFNEWLFRETGLRLDLFSKTDTPVQGYNDVFDKLMQEFHDRAVGDTLVVVHRFFVDLAPTVDDLRESLPKDPLSNVPDI